ncbi:MAG: hypothetical protein RIQ78_1147, partial [Bacteroidota bacterium]
MNIFSIYFEKYRIKIKIPINIFLAFIKFLTVLF